jgi:hypothetical protein
MSLAAFIPSEIMNQVILHNLNRDLVAVDAISRDYEGLLAGGGDSVKIPYIQTVTASTYTRDSTLTYSGLGGTSTTLSVDQQRYFAYSVDFANEAQAAANVANEIFMQASWTLRDAADAYLLKTLYVADALTISGTTGSASYLGAAADAVKVYGYGTGSLNGSGALAYLGRMSQRLDEANVPTDQRWAIVPPWFHSYLVQEKCLTSTSTDGNDAYSNGRVGRAYGMDIRVSTNLTNATAAASEIVAGHKTAVQFAGKLVNSEIIKLETKFAEGVRGLYLYGAKVVQPYAVCLGYVTQS